MSMPDLTPGMYRQCRKEREALYEANAELRERIAELKRREALLTALVGEAREMRLPKCKCRTCRMKWESIDVADAALTEAGFPW
jgi:hypothetical protein